jgi:hypothetical protein
MKLAGPDGEIRERVPLRLIGQGSSGESIRVAPATEAIRTAINVERRAQTSFS